MGDLKEEDDPFEANAYVVYVVVVVAAASTAVMENKNKEDHSQMYSKIF